MEGLITMSRKKAEPSTLQKAKKVSKMLKSTLYIIQNVRVPDGKKPTKKPIRKNAYKVEIKVSADAPEWVIERCQNAISKDLEYFFTFVDTKLSKQLKVQDQLFQAGIQILERQEKLTQDSLAQLLKRGKVNTKNGNNTGVRSVYDLVQQAGWTWEEYLSCFDTSNKPDTKKRK